MLGLTHLGLTWFFDEVCDIFIQTKIIKSNPKISANIQDYIAKGLKSIINKKIKFVSPFFLNKLDKNICQFKLNTIQRWKIFPLIENKNTNKKSLQVFTLRTWNKQ